MVIKRIFLIVLVLSLLSVAVLAVDKRERALNGLAEAEETLKEMQKAGFGIVLVNDTLIEAKRLFYGENYSDILAEVEKIGNKTKKEQAKKLLLAAQQITSGGATVDYDAVLEKTTKIGEVKERAYEVYDLIQTLETRIKAVKESDPIIDLSGAEELLVKAKAEFNNEFYDEVERLAKGGLDTVKVKEAEATQLKVLYKAGRENIINYLQDNWKKVLLTFLGFILFCLIAFYILSTTFLKKELDDLKLEKEVILGIIRRLQEERFEKGSLTQKEYEVKLKRFKERLIDVEKLIPITRGKLNKILPWKRTKNL